MLEEEETKPTRWYHNSTFQIYLSHTLSSWGDRMWNFAVGLYFVILYPDSLQLTAVYGFSLCGSVIISGAFLGKWIDKTQRIVAARLAVIVQNLAVITGAILLALTLQYSYDIKPVWNGKLEILVFAVIIIVAVIAELASVACKIALEKDWIVVLAGGDVSKLSKLNATMRTIDLTTSILAPIVVGQIITYISPIAGAAFIAGWNLVSGIAEYYLLNLIYKRVPMLSQKNIPFIQISPPGSGSSIAVSNQTEVTPDRPNCQDQVNNNSIDLTPGTVFMNTLTEISLGSPDSRKIYSGESSLVQSNEAESSAKQKRFRLSKKIAEASVGWKDYFSHPVRNAGLALAMLYMTVMGFDSITTGFAYSQGMEESIIGIITAVGAVLGIMGSISFPMLRNKLGKNKVGLLGFGLEAACLLLCVGSVFAPGSPFENGLFFNGPPTSSGNSTDAGHTGRESLSIKELWDERSNIFYLMGGIVLARYGLWLADLSVTQIFQEEVAEDKRGILNGVQGSLNQLMNLLKFLLVIILPSPETFGYLIFLSWIFVVVGLLFFAYFTIKTQHPPRDSSKYSTNISTVSAAISAKDNNSP